MEESGMVALRKDKMVICVTKRVSIIAIFWTSAFLKGVNLQVLRLQLSVVDLLRSLKKKGSRLGCVVVSVLATKVAGSKTGQGDEFLRAIKIRSTPSSRIGSKAGRSHVVRFYGM
jgi:hypothetical protein